MQLENISVKSNLCYEPEFLAAMSVCIHWSLLALASFASMLVLLISLLLCLLAKSTKHDLHFSRDGKVYKLIDV